ncbi:MAG: DUF86 domain-containing protein [Oscillospiraceae bacterium]|jgi:uncharacterized protein with HEPN domain|nr:DUF86 domain-containing protein [Oscillospiraceae bacterium]
MDNADRGILQFIRKYCENIAEYIQRFGDDYAIFIVDSAYFDAVSMCIYQTGELSTGLSTEFKELTKDQIPWQKIKGMRNIFAHKYKSMKKDEVWTTATISIPELLAFCNEQLSL